jgi:hypothetical protein
MLFVQSISNVAEYIFSRRLLSLVFVENRIRLVTANIASIPSLFNYSSLVHLMNTNTKNRIISLDKSE